MCVLMQVGLLASKVGLLALTALHATTAALDLYEHVITPVTSKQEGVGPPPPDTPQLLPSVHAIWGALVGALRVRDRHSVSWPVMCLPAGKGHSVLCKGVSSCKAEHSVVAQAQKVQFVCLQQWHG